MNYSKILLIIILAISFLNISCAKENIMKSKTKNRLQYEKSPYLLQHAENPVDWYPWGEEAFAKAKKEDKPIFLSIGYSTCHWCHVMEHESFEDPEVAKLMNETFVSIKVDREERPAIDNIYMTVCQMMTGSGGWPLTIIMTSDKKPFFAGTYFPKESRFGRIGMLQLVPKIAEAWKNRRKELLESANKITGAMQSMSQNFGSETPLPVSLLDKAFKEMQSSYDPQEGGFGSSPKFPTPHRLLFLLRYWQKTGNKDALTMATNTLIKMRQGGIFDQIGYGFHRYSTDREWLVPHFEKMLYDQALMTMAYTEAFQATKDQRFANTANEIMTYIARDMTSPEGGFYTAEDADSDGEEGKFYVWKVDELKEILSEDELKLVLSFYNATSAGNYAIEATGRKNGTNILHLNHKIKDEPKEIAKIRQKLFVVRKMRIHPLKDTKILTDWNGMMIVALAKAGRALNKPEYTQSAEKAAQFILDKMLDDKGRLLHRYKDGNAAIDGKLEDYTSMIWALIELYESTYKVEYLKTALKLNETLTKHFWDKKHGGFFMTADDAEKLLSRPKEVYDGAIPSGNSVAMLNMAYLSGFTGNQGYNKKAEDIGKAFSKVINQSPSSHAMLMCALLFETYPPFEIVIATDDIKAESTKTMLDAINKVYFPNKIIILREGKADASAPEICKIAKFAKKQKPIDSKATAYICVNFACRQPITSVKEMLKLLEK